MADRDALLVAEPQFKGSVHATVNAALLQAAELACPGARRVVFLGEREHLAWVRRALPEVSEERAEVVTWVPSPGLPAMRRVGRVRRAGAEIRAWWSLLLDARRRGARALLICSVSRPGILFLKLLVPVLLPRTPVVVVLHQLNDLEVERGGAGPRRPVRLETLLSLPGPRGLRFAAPARAVHEELARRFPRLAERTVAMDLPYLWQAAAPSSPPMRRGELTFGLFGGARRGSIEPFCRLAARVRARFPGARFVLLGHLKEAVPETDPCREAVEGMGTEAVSLEELRRRADGVHYAVWIAPVEHYRMRLSAAFLDALSFVKPCIYLDNPFVAHYRRELGDVGYACPDTDTLYEVVVGLLTQPPAGRYEQQCERVLRIRERFSTRTAARRLAEILGTGVWPELPEDTAPRRREDRP